MWNLSDFRVTLGVIRPPLPRRPHPRLPDMPEAIAYTTCATTTGQFDTSRIVGEADGAVASCAGSRSHQGITEF